MGYNMNGFSGFGNSPAKQKVQSRQDSINTVDAKIEALDEDFFNEKMSKAEYDKKRKALGKTEDAVKKSVTKPKTKKEMDSFRAAQLETKGSDDRETKRINP